MSKYVSYVRGNEVGSQIKSINEYAIENGFRIDNNYVNIDYLISILENDDTVIINSVDRLARRIEKFYELKYIIEAKGAKIVFVDGFAGQIGEHIKK